MCVLIFHLFVKSDPFNACAKFFKNLVLIFLVEKVYLC